MTIDPEQRRSRVLSKRLSRSCHNLTIPQEWPPAADSSADPPSPSIESASVSAFSIQSCPLPSRPPDDDLAADLPVRPRMLPTRFMAGSVVNLVAKYAAWDEKVSSVLGYYSAAPTMPEQVLPTSRAVPLTPLPAHPEADAETPMAAGTPGPSEGGSTLGGSAVQVAQKALETDEGEEPLKARKGFAFWMVVVTVMISGFLQIFDTVRTFQRIR